MNWWRILFTTWKFGREREMFSVSCNANASFRMLLGPENILFLGHPNNWRVEGEAGNFVHFLRTSWHYHPCARSSAQRWFEEKISGLVRIGVGQIHCNDVPSSLGGKVTGKQLSFCLIWDVKWKCHFRTVSSVYPITKHCHVPSCSEVLSQVSLHLISSSTTFTWRWIVDVGKLRQMIEAFQK